MNVKKPEAWHEARRKYIGASEVATVTGVSQYGSQYELWATKKGLIEPFEGNDATQLGTDLEASLLDIAERDLGALQRDVAIVHRGSLPIRATLDARTAEELIPVECKTAGLLGGRTDAWGETGDVLFEDQIPASYYVQVQTQLLVTDEEFAWLYALVARRGVCKYKVHAHAATQEAIGNAVDAWWTKHMVNNEAPALTGCSKQVLSKIPRRKDSTIELCRVEEDSVELLAELKEQRKAIDGEIRKEEASLIMALADNEVGTLPDGRRVSFTLTERKAYVRNVAASSFRTLRVQKSRKA